FFQAEDGIRDRTVTGVQTCALPICILLSSKALFTPEIRKHLTLRLPCPLPFEGVELPPVGKSRYKSEINPALLLTAAKRELAERSEERRVGKESRAKRQPEQAREKV